MTGTSVSATTFTLQNQCSHTVCPGTLSGNEVAILGNGGFELPPGISISLTASPGWSGRFWARTDCKFDGNGNGVCATGDCGGVLSCTGGGNLPVSLAEFTISKENETTMDFYDVGLVDGYNVSVSIRDVPGAGNCHYAGGIDDLSKNCPPELVVRSLTGDVVACKSACTAFNSSEFCCTGRHSTPDTCSPTQYSQMFKIVCFRAYSYAHDDESSTCKSYSHCQSKSLFIFKFFIHQSKSTIPKN